MTARFRITVILVMLVGLLLPVQALAGSDTNGGITLNYPDDLVSCDPTFEFSTSGVDPSWPLQWDLYEADGAVLGDWVAGGSTFGDLNASFSPGELGEGESATYALFVAVFVPGQTIPTKLSGKWTVTCEDESGGGEGCTPGYWKNHEEDWPISTSTDFDSLFGRDAFDPDITLLEALALGGGHLDALARHAAAAYLNALSPMVDYDLSPADVIASFQAAFDSGDYESTKDVFEGFNEQGCPE